MISILKLLNFSLGNAEDFFRFAKATFNQDVSCDLELLQQIAAENIANGAYQIQ